MGLSGMRKREFFESFSIIIKFRGFLISGMKKESIITQTYLSIIGNLIHSE